jgi:hypothetical protein
MLFCREGAVPFVGRARGAAEGLKVLIGVWMSMSAATAALGENCPFPLGDHLVNGDVRVIDGTMDAPDSLALDTTWFGVVDNDGRFAADGSRVVLAYETEYEYLAYNYTLKTENHVIAYKEFSQRTGWDTRPVFLSSQNVDWPLPMAPSTAPALAMVGQDVWVAWSVAGFVEGVSGQQNPAPFWPSTGSYIVVRGNRNGTWGPIEPLSDLGPVAVNARPTAVSTRSGAFFAFQTNAAETDGDQFHISGRPFDGRAFGPVETISAPADGWSDETASMATDGTRVAAVWSSRDSADLLNGSTRVVLRVREPSGAWGSDVVVNPPGEREVSYPAVTFHDSKWFVAWSAVDDQASSGGDESILLRSFDPATQSLSPLLYVTNGTSPGYDANVAMISFGGTLRLAWTSNSFLPGESSGLSDVDIHMRAWDGTSMGPVSRVDERQGETDPAKWPGFLRVGGALFATYGLNLVEGKLGEHDQRQVIRLLERQPRSEDTLSATYSIRPGSFLGNGSARVYVRFQQPGRTANVSDHYALSLGEGTVVRLPLGFAEGNISLPFRNNKFYAPAVASWCGAPVPIHEVAWPFAVTVPPPWYTSPSVLLPIILVAAIAAGVAWRIRSSRARAHVRRKARRHHKAPPEPLAPDEGGRP